jgi:DNA (cytosine-5)-methyltransferase 1
VADFLTGKDYDEVKHLGDICNINGAEVEAVDVIIGGSPCQDLSVAGKRAGLDGARSGLFMEQIRIIKEMRDADLRNQGRHDHQGFGGSISHAASLDDSGRQRELHSDNTGGTTDESIARSDNPIRPRYMVWENVPGAFSSNKGEDFRIVLEETAKIADETAVIPRPDKGKWTNAGSVMGNGWSIAWRVFDAQFWGVPQRRRRIALVADFGGQSAPEILFERHCVSWDSAESRTPRQGVAGDAANCFRETVGYWGEGVGALRAQPDGSTGGNVAVAGFCQGASPAARTIGYQEEVSPTIKGAPSGTAQVPAVCYPINDKATRYQGGGATRNKDGSGNGLGIGKDGDPAPTLTSGDKHAVFSFDSLSSNSMKSSNPHSGCRQVEVAKCIDTTNPDPSKNQGGMAVVQPTLIEMTSTKNTVVENGICPTLTARMGTGGNQVNAVATYQKTTGPLMANSHPGSYSGQDAYTDMLIAAADCRNGTENPDPSKNQGGVAAVGALCARDYKGVGSQYVDEGKCIPTAQSVRRLTPLECERLQGYEDGWTNIPPQTEVTAEDLSFWRTVWNEWQEMNDKKPKTDKQIIKWLQSEPADSARYKALGNSIALPPWRFVLSRIYAHGARTMGSLFDGIGGFPLTWNELGGQTLWASEVEPFPILVTRYHFKEEHNGK